MDDGSEQLPCDFLSSEEMILPSERPQSPLGNGEEARETFEGEGSEELAARTDELGSSSVMNALKQLVELCDAPENGVVALDKFMDVIENQGFQCSPQDIHSLNQVYNALCAESESKGLFTTGGSGKRDFQVDIHNSKVIRDLLDHYQSRAHLEEIWEPGLSLLLDPSKSGGANPDGNSALLSTPPRRRPCGGGEGSDADDGSSARVGGGHCSSGGSSPATCSSAGILASLEVSMFSTGSKEGTGGDISFLDVAQYEAERAQYQHTIQRLMKQKEDAMRQWSQLDEAHQALAATNKDLVERVRSLCQEMESLKRACSELEETKASLVVTSATCRQAEQLLSQARAAKAALEDQLEERNAQVDSLNERLTKCQDSEKRAVLLASQHRQHLRELEARNQDLEAHLSREASRLNESTAVVKELTSTVESLKQTWKDTEDELRQERDANFRLKELLFERSLLHGSDYYDAVKGDTVESDSATMTSAEANLDSDEGVFNSRSISPASVFFPGDCSPRPICDELSLSALDLQCTSTPRPSQSPAKRPRLPFCGISRLPTWDCSAIQHWYLDEGRLNSVLLSQSSHSSLPPRITALVQENLASAGAEALQAKLQQELEKKEQVIKELEAKVSATREEWSVLEHRHTELWTFLGHSLAALRGIRNDLTMLNDEAVRALESHAGAAAILAGAQQDRQLVSALEDVSPESTYSFPEDVVREQIQLELQTLRAQITKSQAVLTYLQSRGSRILPQPVSECATINRKALVPHRGYSEEGVHPDDRHYDTLEAHRRPRRASGCQACGCAARCRGRHAGRLSSTLSCPALPARDSLMARSTQTEPTTTTMRSRDCQTDDELDIGSVDLVCDDASVVQGTLVEASARTTSSLPGSLSPPFPRHRSNSFVCAIQGGANRTPDEGRGVSGERSSPADTSSAKPKVPMLTFEDFDAQRRETDGQTRKAAFRKCLLEVGRSVAMDLDQPDSSAGTPRPRVPLKKTTFMLERPETESAQGSLEGQEAFPSFTDAVLVSQGLSKDSPSSDQLSEEEIENKFTTLSLGFKTDRLTLTKRLELHQRHRDIAEGNIQAELKAIRDLAQTLDSLYTDDERVREVVAKIRNHLDVIQQSTDRVSSQAEVYGAVQQEERMSRAFEVMVAHVENLKRASEREHRELEEARKLLLDHQLHDVANATPAKDSRGRLSSIPGGSVAGTANSAAGAVRAFRALNLGARRCSLPVPHAMHLPSPTLAHDADAGARAGEAGGKTECHLEEDTASSSVVNAEGLHLHLGARDVGNNAGSSSMAPHEHNGLCADDSSTLQNGVLEELVAAAVQDTLERSDRLNGVEEMDGDDLRAHGTEDEGQEGDADGRVREGLASGHMDVGSIDLLHWAATVVLRVKYWLNRSRQVLAGRKRLAPVTKQRFNAARYFLGGLLVTAALVTVLVVLFPGASSCSLATNRASLVMLWHDLCHRGPGLVMRWSGGPPPV